MGVRSTLKLSFPRATLTGNCSLLGQIMYADKYPSLIFFLASERTGTLNHQIWLANYADVTVVDLVAFYDTAQDTAHSPRSRFFSPVSIMGCVADETKYRGLVSSATQAIAITTPKFSFYKLAVIVSLFPFFTSINDYSTQVYLCSLLN